MSDSTSPASMGGPLSEAERIAEIRARVDAATPGPWRDAGDVSGIETASGESITRGDDSGYGCVYIDDADRALIASAPADLTYLLDMAEDRRARVEALKATSRRTQERLDAATAHIKGMEGQLATARALHKPERRYTPDDGETSYATYAEAADASFDGTGRPAMVTFFEVCSHCASIEMAEGCDHQYKESLWPCEDAVALGLDGGGPDGTA